METFKKYLVLEFSDAGMLLEWKLKSNDPSVKKICELENTTSYNLFRGHNVDVPIPYTTLSNMLAKLMGCVPVPTKPKKRQRMAHDYERPTICDEMAKSAYINIQNSTIPKNSIAKRYIGLDGDYYYVANNETKLYNQGEVINSEKTAVNSNRKDTTVLFNFDNGEPKEMKGVYSFQMLYRAFSYDLANPIFIKLICFINNLLGCDDVLNQYTFKSMAEAIYHLEQNNPEIQEKIKSFIKELKSEWNFSSFPIWMDSIFNYRLDKDLFHTNPSTLNSGNNCSNTENCLSKSYLIYRKGIDHKKVKVSGQIIVEVTDPAVIDMLKENSGVCTCLEGGICRIAGLYNWEPIYNYKENWTKIYTVNCIGL